MLIGSPQFAKENYIQIESHQMYLFYIMYHF